MSKCVECIFNKCFRGIGCTECKRVALGKKEDMFCSIQQYLNIIRMYPYLESQKIKGKWVRCETANYNWCCSVCGCGFTDYRLNYCYDCGAKMEE